MDEGRGLEGSLWIERVVDLLKAFALSFEAEESVRLHVAQCTVEVSAASPTEFAITISMELPTRVEGVSEVDKYAEAFRGLLTMVAKVGRDVAYELDTGVPGYAFLRATFHVEGLDELLRVLRSMLT